MSQQEWYRAFALVWASLVGAAHTTRLMLLSRAHLALWVPVGIVAFFDQVGAGNLQFAGQFARRDGDAPPWEAQWEFVQAGQVLSSWIEVAGESPHMLVFYVLGFLVLAAAGMAILTGIGSLGQLMMVRLASTRRAAVLEHSEGAWPLVRSLWAFRLSLFAVSFVLFIPFFITGMLWTAQAGGQGIDSWSQLARTLAPLVGAWSVVGIAFLAVNGYTRNIIVPIMERRRCDCLDAWGEGFQLLQTHARALVVFFTVRLVILIAFVSVASVISFALCCIGFLPVAHHILFAPYYLFDRSFGLEVLARIEPSLAATEPGSQP